MTMIKHFYKLSLFVLLPNIIGVLIYIAYRPTNLNIFLVASNLGVHSELIAIRILISSSIRLNNILINSLPMRLFSYSCTLLAILGTDIAKSSATEKKYSYLYYSIRIDNFRSITSD